jgi:flagellar basal-body rod modification protein FlgD
MRIDSSTSAGAAAVKAASTSSSSSDSSSTGLTDATLNELGRDEFLTLLVAQLKNQDPMNPVKDSDFVAQLAQFSSLQEIRNLSEATRQASELSVASSAAGLIGRTVEAEIVNSDTGETTTISGEVSEVRMKNGVPALMIGDTQVTLDQVTRIV